MAFTECNRWAMGAITIGVLCLVIATLPGCWQKATLTNKEVDLQIAKLEERR